jgi:hypothetical protein
MLQVKLKKLRQAYDHASAKKLKNGASMDTVLAICPQFEALDTFLGGRPIVNPHFRSESSVEESQTEETDLDVTPEVSGHTTRHNIEEEAEAGNGNEDEIESNVDIAGVSGEDNLSGKRVKLTSPGEKRRKKKGKNVNSDVLDDINQLIEDDHDFQAKQEKMWEEHLQLQKSLLKSREEDRKILEKMLEMQNRESREFSSMFTTLISAVSQRNADYQHPHHQAPLARNPEYAHQPAPSASSDDGQNYAGVGGQQYYDISHNYVNFHNM